MGVYEPLTQSYFPEGKYYYTTYFVLRICGTSVVKHVLLWFYLSSHRLTERIVMSV